MNSSSLPSRLSSSSVNDERFREYAPQGRRYAEAMVGNRADAEEVVQEAFLKILSRHSTNPDPGPFQPLFFTAIRHLCIDMIRKRKTRRSLPLDQVDEIPASEPPRHNRGVELLMNRLPELLQRMPQQWAEAFRARLEFSKTYAEIADDMDATHAQVRSWIFRARQYLRHELKARGNG